MRAIRTLFRAALALIAITSARIFIPSDAQRFREYGRVLRRLFEQLSGVYIKFGQILAMRPDLLPEEVLEELSSLLDAVPAEPLDDSIKTVLAELKCASLKQYFTQFDEKPLAAASFATVYRAVTTTGENVAVKVQRSNLQSQVRQDIRFIRVVGDLVQCSGLLRRFDLGSFIGDFEQWTLEELDYKHEARAMEFIRQTLDEADLRVPEVYWKLSTGKVLTQTLFEGTWLSNNQFSDRSGQSPFQSVQEKNHTAAVIFRGFMRQIFELGFFHSDPHSGNICLLGNGQIGLIDFGITGGLDQEAQSAQLNLMHAIQQGRLDDALSAVLSLLQVPPDADLLSFRSKFTKNVREWNLLQYEPGLPRKERSAARLLLANFRAARQCGLAFNSSAVRYYRTLIVLDSVLLRIDEDFDERLRLAEYFAERQRRQTVAKIEEFLNTGDAEIFRQVRRTISLIPSLIRRAELALGPSSLIEGYFSRIFSALSLLSKSIGQLLLFGTAAVAIAMLLIKFKFLTLTINGSILKTLGEILIFELLSAAACFWAARMFWINAYDPSRAGEIRRGITSD